MIERTGDPVRDAENYYMELESAPMKEYVAYIQTTTFVKCYGRNEDEAKEDAEIKAESLQNNILSTNSNDLMDCELDEITIKEAPDD